MIKISLIIKHNSDTLYTFEVDKNFRFILKEENGEDSVILENVTNEFDGICDENGRMHFLIQSLDGSLIYIKHDNDTWKKYIVFKSKSKLAKMSNISLTWKKGILCGFYVIEYDNKYLLIKHIFSSSNLYATPEVVDVLDTRKIYSICYTNNNMTAIYYKNETGGIYSKTFDKFFKTIETNIIDTEKPIYDFCAVSNGNDVSFAYITERKGYCVLIFSSVKASKKIITFAVPKNSHISMLNTDLYYMIQWTEGDNILCSESYNGGSDFSKPSICNKYSRRNTYREKGLIPGIYYSGKIALLKKQTTISENFMRDNFINSTNNERKQHMHPSFHKPTDNNIFKELNSRDFIEKLKAIEKETENISKDTKKICMFLDELVAYKQSTENFSLKINSQKETPINNSDENKDIGLQNIENIELFESTDIDDIIPLHKEIPIEGE